MDGPDDLPHQSTLELYCPAWDRGYVTLQPHTDTAHDDLGGFGVGRHNRPASL